MLDDESQFHSPEDIDDLISAEIPDSATEPELYELVKTCMMHGPCGFANPQCPCMRDGRCSKQYPMEFLQETVVNATGYPLYRRQNNGRTVIKNHVVLDNRSVVPYSPYLLKKFKAHINVEVLITIRGVSYIFKYIYKGHDSANIEARVGQLDHDEVRQYLDMRYVSAPEAFWRLSTFPMHFQSHTVIRLPVHLPNMQNAVF